MTNTGSENYGGGIVTAGGLFFIAATNFDKKFRAFDKLTGKTPVGEDLALCWKCDTGCL
jgi:glucose dehydrogenase